VGSSARGGKDERQDAAFDATQLDMPPPKFASASRREGKGGGGIRPGESGLICDTFAQILG
jgi:hypothetical protein